MKAVDAETGRELFRFKTASGIVGNVMTYEQQGKQFVAVLSGVGGWAAIGIAAGYDFSKLSNYPYHEMDLTENSNTSGTLTVFSLP